MNTYTFAPKTMTCNGHTYTVEYCLQPSGVVTVFVQLDDRQARIRIDRKMPEYAAARAAAEEARDAWNADTPVNPAPAPTAQADDTPAPAPERAEIISPAAPAPTAQADDIPAPAPEKPFAGTEIAGNGWKIVFDAATQRTRIIFAADPTPAAKKVLDAAGFFWSGRMQSWNKKLTFRAYRAAQAVANDLRTIYPA